MLQIAWNMWRIDISLKKTLQTMISALKGSYGECRAIFLCSGHNVHYLQRHRRPQAEPRCQGTHCWYMADREKTKEKINSSKFKLMTPQKVLNYFLEITRRILCSFLERNWRGFFELHSKMCQNELAVVNSLIIYI